MSACEDNTVDGQGDDVRMCPTPDGKHEYEVRPPADMNESQRFYWFELFDLFNEARVISYIDIPALNILVLSYERIMRDTEDPELKISYIRTVYNMLGKFGCVPAERNVQKVPGAPVDDGQLDIFDQPLKALDI